jgi:hypothetical protein
VLAKQFYHEFSIVGVILLGMGLVYGFRKHRIWFWTWMVALGFSLIFFLWLSNAPITQIFVRVIEKQLGVLLLAQAFFLGLGVQYCLDKVKKQNVILMMCLVFVVWLGGNNLAYTDKSTDVYTEKISRTILDAVEPNAIVFNCYDTVDFALSYFVATEPQYHHVRLVSFLFDREISLDLIEKAYPDTPIYFTFASTCHGQFYLQDIQPYLNPKGMVYQYEKEMAPSRQNELIDEGLALIKRYELDAFEKTVYQDYGIHEVIGWVADAYHNASMIKMRLGRKTEAVLLMKTAEKLR